MTTLDSSAPPKRRLGLKFLQMIAISAALGIVLFVIFLITLERDSRQGEAIRSITRGWGDVQTVAGPALVVPYTVSSVVLNDKNKPTTVYQTRMVALTPDTVNVTAALATETRRRGIYDALLYTGDLAIKGTFTAPDVSSLGINPSSLQWDQAFLVLQMADTVGLVKAPRITLDNEPVKEMLPGLHRVSDYNAKGVFLPLPQRLGGKAFNFSVDFSLRGHEGLHFKPMGRLMTIALSTPWPSLSAVGNFLPTSLQPGQQGSRAEWSIPSVAHGSAVEWDLSSNASVFGDLTYSEYRSVSTVGINLWSDVSSYDSVVRSTKYGVLFVGLSLLVLFLFEVVSDVRLHWTHYTLVGLAIALFYLILLSLSEHIDFGWSYLAAAVSITATITLYAISVLGQRRRAGILFCLLAGLYTLFYIILKQEDYALLMGSVLLFVALSSTMYLTRRLDWTGDGVSKLSSSPRG